MHYLFIAVEEGEGKGCHAVMLGHGKVYISCREAAVSRPNDTDLSAICEKVAVYRILTAELPIDLKKLTVIFIAEA
ncbi:MAG: hypothetical protein J6M35_08040 [Clostridia bacterium]|nr:hypothetical protein [Clostridia bacterium]